MPEILRSAPFYVALSKALEVKWTPAARWAPVQKSDCLMPTGDGTPQLQPTSPNRQLIRRIWTWTILALGLAFTAAWISLLVFGIVKTLKITI